MRAIRKYEVVNEIRGSRDANEDIRIDAGVYRMKVPAERTAELEQQMEANQRQFHYQQNPKNLAGDHIPALAQGSQRPGRNDNSQINSRIDTTMNRVQAAPDVTAAMIDQAYEKRISEEEVKAELTHQMRPSHRNQTFIQFLRQLIMCIKTIENEKNLLINCKDFNINDAFKVLLYGIKPYGGANGGSKVQKSLNQQLHKDIGDLELNTSLLLFPG